MKEYNKIFNAITLCILFLILIGIAGTYLSDYLIDINWFGDSIETEYFLGRSHEREVWGARHYWYNWGVFILFLATFIRLAFYIYLLIDKNIEL